VAVVVVVDKLTLAPPLVAGALVVDIPHCLIFH
jgi:hypothetical protein